MAACYTHISIDLPNLTRSLRQYRDGAYFDPGELIALAGGAHRVVSVFAYADATTLPDSIRVKLERHGIQLVHIACRKGDTDVDNALAADMVELAITRRDITRIVLAAGDGDFRPSFAKARKYGKRTAIVAVQGSISRHLAVLADEVILLRGTPAPMIREMQASSSASLGGERR
jgi:hypothetical protein